jgi:hypothetical protein
MISRKTFCSKTLTPAFLPSMLEAPSLTNPTKCCFKKSNLIPCFEKLLIIAVLIDSAEVQFNSII